MNHSVHNSKRTRNQSHQLRQQATSWIFLIILSFSPWGTEPLSAASFPIQITELMYHPMDGKEFEFVEIQNTGEAPVDLSLASWDGIDFRFEEGEIIQSNEIWIIASNDEPEAFQNRYPEVTPKGYFGKKLSDGGEKIILSDTTGHPIAWADYDDDGFWPIDADGAGYSLERVDLSDDPNSPTAWRRSRSLNGSPGTFSPLSPSLTLQVSEIYATSDLNNTDDVDFIELWNPSETVVDLSGWRITDSRTELDRFTIPNGTMLESKSWLAIPLAIGVEPNDDSAGFALSSSGETLFLYDSLGQPIDAIRFGQQVIGYSISRIAGQWSLSFPTPNEANNEAPTADVNALSINEWKADAESGDTDWIELYNPNPNLPISLAELCLGHGDIMELPPEEVAITPFNTEWSIFRGTTSPSPDDLTAWTRNEFVTEGWEQLTAPFFVGSNPGQGTELTDMAGNYTSLLMRREFNVIDRDQYQTYLVKFKSDDGFIGWFNGSEWGRLRAPSGPPLVDLLATTDGSGDVTDWSFEFDDYDRYITEGPNVIAVQGVSSESVDDDFYIDFSLVGILPPKSAFTIIRSSRLSPLSFVPPNGFIRLNASEDSDVDDLQFRLPPEGTTLALINSTNELITSAKASVASEGVSEGRFPDGSDHITYFTNGESPGRSNLSDKDEDNIPDADELKLGLNPEDPNDAQADADGDGISNIREYEIGTDLNDSRSFFGLKLEAILPGGTLKLTAPRLSRQDYLIEMTNDLMLGEWIEVSAVTARSEEEPGFVDLEIVVEQSTAFFRTTGISFPSEPGPFQVSVTPQLGQSIHPPNQPIILSLSQPIHPESLNQEEAWALTDEFGRLTNIETRFDAGFTRVTLRPQSPLRNDTEYQVTIHPDVTTESGTSIAAEVGDWKFTTAPSLPLVDSPTPYSLDTEEAIRLEVTIVDGETPFGLDDLLADNDKTDEFNPYVRIHLDGENFSPLIEGSNGTMKVRGATSRLARQKSFSIQLDQDENEWMSNRRLNLMKHPYELSRVRNKLSYELFEQIPNITSLRTQFVHLFVNNEDYGLFTHVEQYDERFLENHGLDRDGHLYKATAFEWARYPNELKLKSDPEYNKDDFESRMEIKGNDNHEKLLQLLNDINDPDLDFEILFDQYFNRENYLTWMAFNLLTSNQDTTSQNYLIYSPTDSQTWYFLPWDYDGAWGFRRQPQHLLKPIIRWREGISNYWNVSLHKRFMRVEKNRTDLERKMAELRTTQLTEDNVKAVQTIYKDLVEFFVSRPPDVLRIPTLDKSSNEAKIAEWNGEYDRLPSELPFNESLYFTAVQRPMPIHMGNPKQTADSTDFRWSESEHLLNHSFTYDFEVSSNPNFEEIHIIERQLGLEQVTINLTPPLPSGNYYYRVIIRDEENPEVNWQTPFSSFYDEESDTSFHGIRAFTVN